MYYFFFYSIVIFEMIQGYWIAKGQERQIGIALNLSYFWRQTSAFNLLYNI